MYLSSLGNTVARLWARNKSEDPLIIDNREQSSRADLMCHAQKISP